jgi:excisionase family DNA binding protein
VSGATNPQSPASDQAVIDWYREGLTQEQVGLKAGMSASNVKRVLRRHGVPSRRRGYRSWAQINGPQAQQQVINAYRDGMALRDIEATFGLRRNVIHRLLRRNGVPLRPVGRPRTRPRPPADVTQDGELLLTVAEAAKALRVSKPTVYRMIRNSELEAIQHSPRGLRVRESVIWAYLRSRRTGSAARNDGQQVAGQRTSSGRPKTVRHARDRPARAG